MYGEEVDEGDDGFPPQMEEDDGMDYTNEGADENEITAELWQVCSFYLSFYFYNIRKPVGL